MNNQTIETPIQEMTTTQPTTATAAHVTTEELAAFVAQVSQIHHSGLKAEYPNCPVNHESIGFTVGPKYARMVTQITLPDDRGRMVTTTRSAFGFIDMTNGNILFCAGYKGPAKGPRGNIRVGDASNLWNDAFTSRGTGGLFVSYARHGRK